MAAAPALMVIGTVISAGTAALGAYMQSAAAKAQAKYQARVAEYNAEVARVNANTIRDVGEQKAEAVRTQVIRTKGAAVARMAANGLLVDDPNYDATSIELMGDIAQYGQLDIENVKYNTEVEAKRAEQVGVNYDLQAGLFNLSASMQKPGLSAMLAAAGPISKGLGNFSLLGGSTPTTSATWT